MSKLVVSVYASVINGWMSSRMSEYLKGLVLLIVQRGSVTRVENGIRSFAHRCLPPEQALNSSQSGQELDSSAYDVQRAVNYLAIGTRPCSIFFARLWLPGYSENCRHQRCPNTFAVVFLDLVWVYVYVARRCKGTSRR